MTSSVSAHRFKTTAIPAPAPADGQAIVPTVRFNTSAAGHTDLGRPSPGAPSDLSRAALRLTAEERRNTPVLFFTKHATDLTDERARRFGYTVVYHASILATLRALGLTVTPGSDPELLLRPLDAGFIYFTQIEDQFQGHELLIPAVAAFRRIPFLGPPAPMRALSEDKVLAKALAVSIGIDVAKHHVIQPARPGTANLSLPGRWILKPRTGVMSEHVALIDSDLGWRAALANASHPRHGGREFLAEEFVPGLNLAVPVIEGFPAQSLPVFIERGESRDNILTEAGKEGHSSDYKAEPYTGPGAAEASTAAAKLAAAMAPFDYARFDFRFDPAQNRLVFLEVNMNCAMGQASVVTRAASLRGLDYPTLVGHIVAHSLRRQRRAL